MEIIERLESDVRSYSRAFPAVFGRAEGTRLFDQKGRAYLDFFAGAGALNYGHNQPVLRDALLDYVRAGGVVHSLDMATEAKVRFLETLEARILAPRDLRYKVMFPGPTGTNAVEAALKLARKVTGRTHVVSFTNAFHGMTLGSLAATGNASKRAGAGIPLEHVTRLPFDGYFGPEVDTLAQFETFLADGSSGIEPPAAFIVETVQAEGGINVASASWLKRLAALTRKVGALLIVDDIQVGCGRTGAFFSFEEAGLQPDIVCLSKSLSGYGLPFAVNLLRPELDAWKPGEHNGTFRGHNLAFVTAAAAFEHFWADEAFSLEVQRKAVVARRRLEGIAAASGGTVRGRGLILGLAFEDATMGRRVSKQAFELGLVIETAGPDDEVVKLLPPLTLSDDELAQGLDILATAVQRVRGPAPLQNLEPARAKVAAPKTREVHS